jgi:hypothetical protein
MVINKKISFQKLIYYLTSGIIVSCNLDKLPLIYEFRYRFKKYQFPKLNEIPFENFIKCMKFISGIDDALLFIAAISGYTTDRLCKLPATKLYPIFAEYAKDCDKMLKMFKELNDEMPSQKKAVKTMEEFGLTNIVNFIADGNIQLHDMILDKPVMWVYVEYRRKAHSLINELANIPKSK